MGLSIGRKPIETSQRARCEVQPASRKLTGFADAIGEETLDAANAEQCRRDPAA
jgi:hypothetical protein